MVVVRSAVRLLAFALLLSLAACGTADRGTFAPSAGASASPSAASSGLTVSGAWVRAAASTSAPTAGYLTIVNGGSQDDALTGASSSAVADSVQVHETAMDSSGMAGMHPVERVAVAAGATVKLEPGGYHLMIMGLKKALTVGDTVALQLTFEHAGTIVVQAEVRQG